MSRAAFGQREKKQVALQNTQALKQHATYCKDEKPAKGRGLGRLLAWISFCTVGFVATIALAAGHIVGKGLPL